MSGLLIKDFRLLRGQVKSSFLYVIVIGVMFTFFTGNYQFWATYITIFIVSFCVGTVSYDEFDKGYAYLFTLPVSRRGYVREKYLFGMIMVTASCALSLALGGTVQLLRVQKEPVRPADMLYLAPVILLLGFVMLAVLLPVYLKYGAERGRMVILLVYLGIAVAVLGPLYLMQKAGIDPKTLDRELENMPRAVLAGAAALFLALLFAGSLAVSYHIMERKEF